MAHATTASAQPRSRTLRGMRRPAVSALAFLGSGMDRHFGDGLVLLLELVGVTRLVGCDMKRPHSLPVLTESREAVSPDMTEHIPPHSPKVPAKAPPRASRFSWPGDRHPALSIGHTARRCDTAKPAPRPTATASNSEPIDSMDQKWPTLVAGTPNGEGHAGDVILQGALRNTGAGHGNCPTYM